MEELLNGLGSAIGGIVTALVNWIIAFFMTLIVGVFNGMAAIFLKAMSFTPDTITVMLGGMVGENFQNFIIGLGVSIAALIAVWELVKGMTSMTTGEDNAIRPSTIAVRTLLFGAATFVSINFSNMLFGAVGAAYSDMLDAGLKENSLTSLFESASNSLTQGNPDTGFSLVGLIIGSCVYLLVIFNFIRLLFESTVRYGALIIYIYWSPIAVSFGVSPNLSKITWGWAKTFLSTLFLWFMNVWLIFAGVRMIGAIPGGGGTDINLLGRALVAYGYMKCAMQIDSIINQVGGSVARVQGGFLRDVMAAAHMGTMAHTAQRNIASLADKQRSKKALYDSSYTAGINGGMSAKDAKRAAKDNVKKQKKTNAMPYYTPAEAKAISQRKRAADNKLKADEKKLNAFGQKIGAMSNAQKNKMNADNALKAAAQKKDNTSTNLQKAQQKFDAAKAAIGDNGPLTKNLAEAQKKLKDAKPGSKESLDAANDVAFFEAKNGLKKAAADDNQAAIGLSQAKSMAQNANENLEKYAGGMNVDDNPILMKKIDDALDIGKNKKSKDGQHMETTGIQMQKDGSGIATVSTFDGNNKILGQQRTKLDSDTMKSIVAPNMSDNKSWAGKGGRTSNRDNPSSASKPLHGSWSMEPSGRNLYVGQMTKSKDLPNGKGTKDSNYGVTVASHGKTADGRQQALVTETDLENNQSSSRIVTASSPKTSLQDMAEGIMSGTNKGLEVDAKGNPKSTEFKPKHVNTPNIVNSAAAVVGVNGKQLSATAKGRQHMGVTDGTALPLQVAKQGENGYTVSAINPDTGKAEMQRSLSSDELQQLRNGSDFETLGKPIKSDTASRDGVKQQGSVDTASIGAQMHSSSAALGVVASNDPQKPDQYIARALDSNNKVMKAVSLSGNELKDAQENGNWNEVFANHENVAKNAPANSPMRLRAENSKNFSAEAITDDKQEIENIGKNGVAITAIPTTNGSGNVILHAASANKGSDDLPKFEKQIEVTPEQFAELKDSGDFAGAFKNQTVVASSNETPTAEDSAVETSSNDTEQPVTTQVGENTPAVSTGQAVGATPDVSEQPIATSHNDASTTSTPTTDTPAVSAGPAVGTAPTVSEQPIAGVKIEGLDSALDVVVSVDPSDSEKYVAKAVDQGQNVMKSISLSKDELKAIEEKGNWDDAFADKSHSDVLGKRKEATEEEQNEMRQIDNEKRNLKETNKKRKQQEQSKSKKGVKTNPNSEVKPHSDK